jgi:hypothetical protein
MSGISPQQKKDPRRKERKTREIEKKKKGARIKKQKR